MKEMPVKDFDKIWQKLRKETIKREKKNKKEKWFIFIPQKLAEELGIKCKKY